MSSITCRFARNVVFSVGMGLLAMGASHATTTPFVNPYSGSGQSTAYVSFTAAIPRASSTGSGFTREAAQIGNI